MERAKPTLADHAVEFEAFMALNYPMTLRLPSQPVQRRERLLDAMPTMFLFLDPFGIPVRFYPDSFSFEEQQPGEPDGTQK